MNTQDKTFAEENDQVITNEVWRDPDGAVIAEEITCETSTRLPVLKLAANDERTLDDIRIETFHENNRPSARA